MRRFFFSFGILAIVSALGISQTVPKVLLIQRRTEVVDNVDINVNVRPFFAQEIESEGRLEPISWAMSDATFRKAVEDKVLLGPPEVPTLEEALAVAEKLKCEYVLFVLAMKHQNNVFCDAQLYKGKRQIWKGNTSLGAQIQDQMSVESTSRSIARTWLFELGSGALKSLTPRPRSSTPEPVPSQTPVPPVLTPDPTLNADFAAIRSEYERLVKLGETGKAVRVLRDAVDASPLSWERRRLLIEALMSYGLPGEASTEARRSTGLFPEELELWRICARASLIDGDSAQAIRDLNEAISRQPDDAATRSLLGQAQLLAGRIDFALEHFDAAIKKEPTADLHYFRAFAFAMKGDSAKSKSDLQAAGASMSSLSESSKSWLQKLAIVLLWKRGDALGGEVRDLVQQSRLKPAAATNRTRANELFTKVDALLAICSIAPHSTENEKKYNVLGLALNLLGQSVIEVQSFLSGKSETTLEDATITLGEALKAFASMKTMT